MTLDRLITPPQLAKRYGCDPTKIIRAIERGDLAAINLAEPGTVRPRYRITPEAIAAFERSKMRHPPAAAEQPAPRRPKRKPAKEYV